MKRPKSKSRPRAAAPRDAAAIEPAPQTAPQRVRDGSVFFPHISTTLVKRLELYRSSGGANRKPPRTSLVAYAVHDKTDEGDVALACGGGAYLVRPRKHDGSWFDDTYAFHVEGEPRTPSQGRVDNSRASIDETPNGIVGIPGANPRTNMFFAAVQHYQSTMLQMSQRHEERIEKMFTAQAACMASMAGAVAGAQNLELVASMRGMQSSVKTELDTAQKELLKTKEENLELKHKTKSKLAEVAINGVESLFKNAPEVVKQIKAGWQELNKEVDAEIAKEEAAEAARIKEAQDQQRALEDAQLKEAEEAARLAQQQEQSQQQPPPAPAPANDATPPQ